MSADEPTTFNSLWYWHSRVNDERQPDTARVDLGSFDEFLSIVDDPRKWIGAVDDAIVYELGGYPAFIRSPYAAGDLESPNSPVVRDKNDLPVAMRAAVESHTYKWRPEVDSLVVREHIDIQKSPAGYPLEWRVLAESESGDIISDFDYYFDRDASHDISPPWNEIYRRAGDAAQQAGTVFDAWSVDFAMDADGQWWLIDMADAAMSGRPDGVYEQKPDNFRALHVTTENPHDMWIEQSREMLEDDDE